MPRSKGSGVRTRRRHKKILNLAKGYRGTRSKLQKRAHEAVLRAGEHAFEGRKNKKRDMKKLWIVRINAALSKHDIMYSRFMAGLKKAKIDLNRKMLAEMAINDPKGFKEVVEKVKKFL
ncbi:50S ribosomal protein L20 [candidate division WWE3 bacterium]|uniref:Large ribosomal subunit protein bL20 n=1 Tax=candidate division WWE3 bacterium TaxID=2053526 RepID=A0A7X9HSR5_UNCKA|nr:50S ribosomal protein L20 [candidate division WWE3 bacterium]